MKYRSDITVYLEILGALLEQPRLKTNLAQIANVNLGRFGEVLDKMVRAELVKKDQIESHEVFRITEEGRKFWEDLYRLERKLNPDETMPSRRLWG